MYTIRALSDYGGTVEVSLDNSVLAADIARWLLMGGEWPFVEATVEREADGEVVWEASREDLEALARGQGR
jgi:hypothetical protein